MMKTKVFRSGNWKLVKMRKNIFENTVLEKSLIDLKIIIV